MSTISDDNTLIEQIAQEQTGALGELYDRYGRLVFSVAYHITNNRETAEEITQDVFTQVWGKALTYHSDQGKVVTWLASIARNRSIDIFRKQNVRPEGHAASLEDDLLMQADESAAVEPAVDQALQRQKVLQALAQLPLEQRQCLALAYFQGMTQQDIASELNQPLGTVKTRIRLGMIKLKEMLE
jgi:RNA polymerase sigma-70 factor (ECF subfamily)